MRLQYQLRGKIRKKKNIKRKREREEREEFHCELLLLISAFSGKR